MTKEEFEMAARELVKELVDAKKKEGDTLKRKTQPGVTWEALIPLELELYLAQTETLKIERKMQHLREGYIENC